MIKRREFIVVLGGAAAWPLAAHAQQPDRIRRIGAIWYEAEGAEDDRDIRKEFTLQLRKLGWIEGRNIHIDFRFAGNLVALQLNVILAGSPAVVSVLQAATRTIPIVFRGGTDPVAGGLVAVARPGGNVTGFTNNPASIATKRLQLLKQIAPRITHVALLYDPAYSPPALAFLAELEAVATSMGVKVAGAAARNPAEIENALAALAGRPGGGLLLYTGGSTNTYLDTIVSGAAMHDIPAVYRDRQYVAAGGLASYGADPRESYRGSATYVDRILRGAKPADLPVQQPTKFELVLNLKTAKALGLTIPETLLATADEVIQ